jgi:hypothetical protein
VKILYQIIDICHKLGLSCIHHKSGPEEPLTLSRLYVGSFGRHRAVSSHLPRAINIKPLHRFATALYEISTRRAALRTYVNGVIMLLSSVKLNLLFLTESRCRVLEDALSPKLGIRSLGDVAPSCCWSPPQPAGTKVMIKGIYRETAQAGAVRVISRHLMGIDTPQAYEKHCFLLLCNDNVRLSVLA